MNKNSVSESDLQAYLDHQLEVGRAADVEAYLAQHPEESKRLAAYRRQNEALHRLFDPVLNEAIPERLWQRRPGSTRYATAAAWLAIGIALGWSVHEFGRWLGYGATPGWAYRAAVAHAVYSPEVRHPVEVGADQEAHLVNWLSKRLGIELKVPQLGALGYSLVGGRLLPGESGPVALFMYQNATGQRLTLYVRVNGKDTRETALRFARENSIGVFYWMDEKCAYAVSGEMDKPELLRITTTMYRQLDQ